jgi:hypothetical protein
MAQDPEITQVPDNSQSVQGTKPDLPPPGTDDPYAGPQYDQPVDKKYWLACLADAERAEEPWRKRAREIIQIYRNESKNVRTSKAVTGDVTFNILYANTEVMLPAVYQKPPKPVVRSRFTKPAAPPPPPMPMMPGMGMPPGAPPPGMGPAGPAPALPLNAGPVPGGPVPPSPVPPLGAPPPAGGPPPGVSVPGAPPGGGMAPPGSVAQPTLDLAQPGPNPLGPPAGPPPGPPMGAAMQQPIPPPPAPSPEQQTIETAAAVMEKALDIVLEDEGSDEAIKMAIKDVLLPGRGLCRVRWKPEMQSMPLPGGPLPDGTAPTEEQKVWEMVGDEYVYWEDVLIDPVRASADTDWIAFRHLFSKEALDAEFAGSPEYEKLKSAGKVGELLKWTDESAAKNPVGGGSALKSAQYLGDYIKKCMVWEIWHRPTSRVIWFIREVSGIILRIDPDILQLEGFFPCPVPMLAVTTSDSRIPRPYYDLYRRLAEDLDETSVRISRLTRMIKVRGGYNSASTEIADILLADDGKMIPVDGVDLLNGGLQNHIWLVPIVEWMNALDKLLLAREQIKNTIYEVMGISDIMRGATRASETATAQRIKGSMGVARLEDQRQAAANFVRDLLRLKAEIICQNFSPETLSLMTGEEVTPEVMAVLRSDFMRVCTIDIETESTVVPDLQAEQEGMAMVMQSVQLVMQGTQQMLMTQILPPPQVMQLGLELLKMALHPVRFSRGVVEMINQFQQQLAQMPPMPPMPPPMGPGLPPPGLGPGGPPPGPGHGAPPPGGLSKPNGGMPPIPMAA